MSGQVTCTGCGGTYSRTCRDGSHYFHVCPPIVDTAALSAQAAAAGITPDQFQSRRGELVPLTTRPDHRDENVDPEAHAAHFKALEGSAHREAVKAFDRGDAVPYIRSAGKGTTPA